VGGEDAEAAVERAEAGGLRTGTWWAARAALLQQRLLARGAASLRATLVALVARTLAVHAPPGVCGRGGRRLRRVAAAAQLEAALMEHEYRCACGVLLSLPSLRRVLTRFRCPCHTGALRLLRRCWRRA
jgi:hypothetical protein